MCLYVHALKLFECEFLRAKLFCALVCICAVEVDNFLVLGVGKGATMYRSILVSFLVTAFCGLHGGPFRP